MATSRTVLAYDAPDAPLVNITRLSGTGPRRSGDRYRAVVVSGKALPDTEGRRLEVEYAGKRGGMDVWRVAYLTGSSWTVSGDLAFLTASYGDAPVSA